ncbi:U3 small nucleolar RNA-associated protein 11 [Xylariaceae sp. FL0255]|nr:U3 small nucleolar RNA-associated protein 11 [Xylariaceae sp. FL0255]
MSSLRNTVNRRVHRERGQLKERENRYGLLEKKKDYSLRAKDHNKKKAQLKSLRQKAADRNEDEFYFGMLSRKGPSTALSTGSKKWDGTVAGDRGNKALDMDTVRLLKTQDMGYLRTVRNVTTKEIRVLEERVIALGGSLDDALPIDEQVDDDNDDDMDFDFGGSAATRKTKPKKIIFADAIEEREEHIRRDAAGQAKNNSFLDEDEDTRNPNPEQLRQEQKQQLLEKLHRRLQAARKKERVLSRAEHELEMQRARMAKTQTIGGVTKSGKKFKIRERKK